MREITLAAHAKINLTLDITGKRPDGYHELESVMQQVELADEVTIRLRKDSLVTVVCNNEEVPVGPANIACKALEQFRDYVKMDFGADIVIDKRIPVAGGMAGGSTDAAAVLIGLNRLLDRGLSQDQLMAIAVKIGADVPFCILGGTAVARGVGEVLTPIQAPPEMWLVLVKPPFGVATAAVYQNFRIDEASASKPNLPLVLEGIKTGTVQQVWQGLGNVLESVTLKMHPVIQEIKEKFTRWGADAVLMSGSGPTVCAFAESRQKAETLKEKAQRDLPGDYRIVVTCILKP